MYKSMQHLNNHLLVAVDFETTGLEPGYHEIWQAAFIPLDENLEPSKTLPMCDLLMRPLYPKRMDHKTPGRDRVIEAIDHGLDPTAGFDIFENWVQKLGLPENKRLVPVAHNWSFEHRFAVDWMGWNNFNFYFDGRARDTLVIAQYLMDRADFNQTKIPFAGLETKLNSLANHMQIELHEVKLHDAIYDAHICAKLYKAFVKELFT